MALSLSFTQEEAAGVVNTPVDFEAVYRRHFSSVWRVLRRLGVGTAQLDDATQDVFLVVHRRLFDFGPHGPAGNWVLGVAVRVASEYRRRALRRHAEPLPESVVDTRPGPARQSEIMESVRLLHEVLAELDEKKRTVFVLAELEQLTVPEIAEALGVNLNTVYSRLRAARRRFDRALIRRRTGTGALP